MNQDNLHELRTDYSNQALDIDQLNSNPIHQFKIWFQEALDLQVPEPNAFSLATVNSEAQPSNRIVLIKEIQDDGIVFYTNYNSQKGLQIAENNHVAACFFWQPLAKQVRIEGTCFKIDPHQSDQYFQKRPLDSQIGAVTSPQSQVIESREWLEQQWQKNKEALGSNVDRPDYWGGYLIKPTRIEFWQGQPSRLHDRFLYQFVDSKWIINRLAP